MDEDGWPPTDLEIAAELPDLLVLHADELRRVGEELISMAENISPTRSVREHVQDLQREPERAIPSRRRAADAWAIDHRLAVLASLIYKIRRKRSAHLSRELLAEPGWDILLDLFVSRVQQRVVTVTSVCLAADVPATTGLRWINILEEQDIIKRVPVPTDRRAFEVRLTQMGYRQMRKCLSECLPLTRI